MRFNLRIPRVANSTVDGSFGEGRPVLDGSDVTLPNDWKLPAHTVALIGRPAVWVALEVVVPTLSLRPLRLGSRRIRLEQDFGGHLLIAIVGADTSFALIVEAGPRNADGTGGLVPYRYPEDAFAKRGVTDFEPIRIAPPNGMSEEAFAELVERTQRAYDGDQRYLAIEIPFLRVGRDSNSYTVGVLLAAGVDPRDLPTPRKPLRWEITGYPGAEDPVHRGNFGTYLGAPRALGDDATEIAYHDDDGGVRFVAIGGAPNGRVRLPSAEDVALDANGRVAFDAALARRHGLPTRHTPVPDSIAHRRRFPTDPQPAGAEITIVVDGCSVALRPGTRYRGRIVARNDALRIAFMRTATADVVLPLSELAVELRDPMRVDRLMRVGNEVTVGLHRDRHPWLTAHGTAAGGDLFRLRRLHVPRPSRVAAASAGAAVALAGVGLWLARR